ncbi:MAG: hypothetical protein ABJA70_08465 [Chryseolinea sp.]
MRIFSLYMIMSAGILVSRESKEDCCAYTPDRYLKSWRLAETGYSIGSGYTMVEVPSDPLQILKLDDNGEITSTVNELEGYRYYKVITGSNVDDVVNFYKSKGDRESLSNERAYSIVFGEGTLRLTYHYCTEGCHLGFVPAK